MEAREVIENELIQELDVYRNGNIVYFIDHANVWYTSTGGVQPWIPCWLTWKALC